MFSCVWLHFKKISEKYFLVFGKEGKDKPRKIRTKPRLTLDARLGLMHRAASRDRDRRRDLTKRQSRSREAPRRLQSARRRDRDQRRDLAKHRSRSHEAPHRSRLARKRDRNGRREIAIDDTGACERRGLELGACERCGLVRASPSRALAFSLSLSLSLEFI